jgi:glutathione synthase/RimK-type ligase-like ATP-grasp enzyme
MRRQRAAFYRQAWKSAAEATGASLRPLSDEIFEITQGGRRLKVSGSTTSLDDAVTWQLAGDKASVYRMLAAGGVPIPHHLVVDAGKFADPGGVLRTLPPPLVVKPAADTGSGDGVSMNVRNAAQLRRAVAWARAFCRRVLVETQIDGDCYRVLLLDGEILDIVMRRPPRVVGDGRSTLRQLIVRENGLRRQMGTERAQVLLRHDPDLATTLASQKLSLRSRPAKDRIVALKRVVNDNRAEENEPANGRLCHAILQSVHQAADIVGLRLVGIDLICGDPGLPLEQSGGVVLEINASPGFYYHYNRRGAGFPVASQLLRRLFAAEARYEHA